MLRPYALAFAKKCVLPKSSSADRFVSTTSKCSTFKPPEPGTIPSFDDNMKNEEWQKETTNQNGETFEKAKPSEKCVNSVTLLGRVGNNPVLRGTETNPVVTFSLATSIDYRPGGENSGREKVRKTEWHNVAVFKPYLRETAYNYVAKGNRVMVQGRIMYGSIEDNSGMIRHTTSIAAEDIIRFAPGSNRDE